MDVPDTEENISSCIIWETGDEDNFPVKLANFWPDFVSLNASMIPTAISGISVVVERIDNGRNLGKIDVYNAPALDPQSHIDNHKLCCSKVVINFENTGTYCLEKDIFSFCGQSFDDYEIKFQSKSLFEKNFLTCANGTAISEKYTTDSKGVPLMEHPGGSAKCKIYPYAGFYEYGLHPKRIESCIFRTSHDGRSLYLRISPLSALHSAGIDPTSDQISETGYKFIGVKQFSESQKMNLYDELKSGACKIEVLNKNTNEKCFYKSDAVAHIAKTNLITINFIKK
jgi:hypothetical protein